MSNRNYEKAVAALVAYPTTKEAAKAAGMGESTLRAYKSDPEFVELYAAARHELLDAGVKSMQERFSEAVETVCEIMHDKTASHSVRLSAANSIINSCVQLTDEVERMERAASGRKVNRELFGGLSDFFPAGK
ncbi:hypothetical protein [Thermophilibacter immobilis]|uniref:Homeodomain phBC6A51-type domain-containing protein n=1 Tax=Thermophilibacter immobilis TaxID=2779519 RepID=A0A7S7RV73_9ACTN|nr:hypothetical protein [Thermophilibacter immobilis]QOY61338.1 hypothetical protein INP52_03885 [Thermophilibacter immobilis]